MTWSDPTIVTDFPCLMLKKKKYKITIAAHRCEGGSKRKLKKKEKKKKKMITFIKTKKR